MKPKLVGIYYIKNKYTQQLYIGQSKDVSKRWSTHKNELKKGVHACYRLQDDWILFGGESSFEFGMIRECKEDELDHFEQIYLDRLPKIMLYNIMTRVGEVPNRVKRSWKKRKKQ